MLYPIFGLLLSPIIVAAGMALSSAAAAARVNRLDVRRRGRREPQSNSFSKKPRIQTSKRRNDMRTIRTASAVLLAALIALGGAGAVFGQTSGADLHHPVNLAQAAPQSGMPHMMGGGMMGQGQGAMPDGPGVMAGGMMAGNMMQSGMVGGMPMMGIRGPMMKIVFAIADTNGDGALSFEEVMMIHRRIFDSVDANKDGKVTPEEMQTFWQQ